jgi:beta-lactamase regulating signal transducer with metallopeptidase domain
MTFPLALVLRSSLILIAGLLAMPLLRKRSAALRHFVLVVTIFAAAAVVPLSLVLPGWDVALPASVQLASPLSSEAPAEVTVSHSASFGAAEMPAPAAVPALVLVWSAGFVVTGGVLALAVVRMRRIARRAQRLDTGSWPDLARTVAATYGLRRNVVILRTDVPGLLATSGVRRPQVLIPPGASTWPEDRVAVVLRHELAHIRRHDWLVQIVGEALVTLAWFNPLMWLACRRLRRESELACDDAVIAGGVAAGDYASHLLALARICRGSARWTPATPMAHSSTLERRIAAMLNPDLDRAAPSRRALFLILALLGALTVPAAAFRGAQAAPAGADRFRLRPHRRSPARRRVDARRRRGDERQGHDRRGGPFRVLRNRTRPLRARRRASRIPYVAP